MRKKHPCDRVGRSAGVYALEFEGKLCGVVGPHEAKIGKRASALRVIDTGIIKNLIYYYFLFLFVCIGFDFHVEGAEGKVEG